MQKTPPGIDGFVPRRPTRSIGDAKQEGSHRLGRTDGQNQIGEPKQQLTSTESSVQNPPRHVTRSDISESLQHIDDEAVVPPKKRKLFGRKKHRSAPISPRKKRIKRAILALLILMVVLGAYVGIKALLASANIFQGNVFDILLSKPLKEDANGRTNILVLGSTDDDPEHPGNTLTDTMLVMSIDQNKKEAAMFSLPRDLWVEYGQACNSGYEGKLNGYFYCTNDGTSKEDEQERLTAAQAFVGEIVGLDVQYAVHVNSVVVRDAVNAVNGIDVDIQSKDPRGILDRNFDGACNYQCYKVKYTNGVHTLNGEAAMYLAMARGANGGYGLGSNFEREQNQQNVIVGLQKKATSSGVLSNPAAITNLIDSVGNNLRTNFEASEIQTLIGLAKDIPASKIQRIQLNSETNPVVTTGNVGPASVVQPVEGLFEYADLRQYIRKQISADAVTKEEATLVLYNGSGVAGLAAEKSDKLSELGYNVLDIGTAPDGTYETVEIYALNTTKPATVKKLEGTYKVTAKTTTPPVPVDGTIDIIIIYGPQPSSTEQ